MKKQNIINNTDL